MTIKFLKYWLVTRSFAPDYFKSGEQCCKVYNKGKITVSVRLLNEDEEKATIEFAVTDTGIGIPENKIEKILKIFSRHPAALQGYMEEQD